MADDPKPVPTEILPPRPSRAVAPNTIQRLCEEMIALREKIIAGEAPGLKEQSDLFTDAIGHVKAPAMVLNTYCHYAVIYRKSPVGLPMPAVLKGSDEKLNRLLQELAWDAVTHHPLSGVKAK